MSVYPNPTCPRCAALVRRCDQCRMTDEPVKRDVSADDTLTTKATEALAAAVEAVAEATATLPPSDFGSNGDYGSISTDFGSADIGGGGDSGGGGSSSDF